MSTGHTPDHMVSSSLSRPCFAAAAAAQHHHLVTHTHAHTHNLPPRGYRGMFFAVIICIVNFFYPSFLSHVPVYYYQFKCF